MKVASYSRVSTPDQSVSMQQSDLRGYCTQRGFTIYREYNDIGISGTKERHPALDALMADARKRKFDVVLVWRFDRLARSTRHLITALEELRHLGIEFISYNENIDTSSPLGKALFVIVAAVAELERNIIVEWIKGGLRRAKALGKPIGRPSCTTPAIVERVRALHSERKSLRVISQSVGISRSLVHKIIRRPL